MGQNCQGHHWACRGQFVHPEARNQEYGYYVAQHRQSQQFAWSRTPESTLFSYDQHIEQHQEDKIIKDKGVQLIDVIT